MSVCFSLAMLRQLWSWADTADWKNQTDLDRYTLYTATDCGFTVHTSSLAVLRNHLSFPAAILPWTKLQNESTFDIQLWHFQKEPGLRVCSFKWRNVAPIHCKRWANDAQWLPAPGGVKAAGFCICLFLQTSHHFSAMKPPVHWRQATLYLEALSAKT